MHLIVLRWSAYKANTIVTLHQILYKPQTNEMKSKWNIRN